MNISKKLLLFFAACCTYSSAYSQIEVARIQSKDFSGNGFGAFLNLGFAVNQSDVVSTEAGLYVLSNGENHVAETPLLLGYRHLLVNSDHGLYVEPLLGYSFSFTDIQKTDANGYTLYNAAGNEEDQQMKGPTTGLGFGYLFKRSGGRIPIQFNIGVRYEHVFVTGYSSPNIFSLRISHGFVFGKRN